MGIMIQVTGTIKDEEGDIIAVRGKEFTRGQETEEKTWKSSFIYNPSRSDEQSLHYFSVKTPDGKGEVFVNCKKKGEKTCLCADLNGSNLLEKLPIHTN